MKIKDTLRRIEAADVRIQSPPDWDIPGPACVREALTAAPPTLTEARVAVAAHYARLGVDINPEAVRFGIHPAYLQSIIGKDNVIAVENPGDMRHLRIHVGDGRSRNRQEGYYRGVEYMTTFDEIDFKAALPMHEPSLVHLSSPSAATGMALNEKEMLRWVRYAEQTGMTIFHDASLGLYAREKPRTLLATEGAKATVLETVSLAPVGLPGLCYAIIAAEFTADNGAGNPYAAAATIRNYLVEPEISPRLLAGLVALYDTAGQNEWEAYRAEIMARAEQLRAALMATGIACWGGEDAPILWAETTDDAFLRALHEAGAVSVPGIAYGPGGAGYTHVRITENTDPVRFIHYLGGIVRK